MKSENGTCRFCGQLRIVQIGDDKEYSQPDLDTIASSECNCSRAAAERKINFAETKAKEAIETVLRDDATKSASEILKRSIDDVARGFVKKISVNIDGCVTASMWLTKKGYIGVERRETIVDQAGAEDE